MFQGARFIGNQPLERADGNLGGAPLPLSLGMVHSTLGARASLSPGVEDSADDEELIRADAARFAECVLADPRLRQEYRRRRSAAAGRFAARPNRR